MRSEIEMYRLILDYAQKDSRVRAVILNGSRANPQAVPDSLRDYDIVYLVTEIEPYKNGDISPAFGDVLVMERTDESQMYNEHFPNQATYLMQFKDGNRIDLSIALTRDYRPYCFDDRLSLVLLDKDGFLPRLLPPDTSTHYVQRPSISLFRECRTEFWWTVPYVSKALLRRQLSYAQNHMEVCTRAMLRLMLGWLSGAEHGFSHSVGKYSDDLEKYLTKPLWELYQKTYAPWDLEKIWDSLLCACSLFTQASQEVAAYLGFSFDPTLDNNVVAFIKETQPMIAKLPPAPGWDHVLKDILPSLSEKRVGEKEKG